MKTPLKNLMLICALVAPIHLCAQTQEPEVIENTEALTQDFSTRIGFDIGGVLYRNLSLKWEEEARFKTLSTTFDRLYSTLSLSYKVNPYFKTAIGYSFHLIHHDGKKSTNYEKYWLMRHRIYMDLTGSYHYNQWQFSLRERPMMTYRTDNPDLNEKANPHWQLRSKFMAEYTCISQPLKPYISVELSNTLNAPKFAGNYIDALRGAIGLKWRIDRRDALNFYYRIDCNWTRDIDVKYADNDIDIVRIKLTHKTALTHILSIAYSFDW
ncbi:MAG: DUF2490 domain-containing protein [Paludibacteraceae bacterium]